MTAEKGLEEAEGREGGKDAGFGGEMAEGFDGLDAGGVEGVVDVAGEVVVDGGGGDGDAGGPLADEIVDMGEAVVAGGLEVGGDLGGGDSGGGEGLGADGPDRGDPGQTGAEVPLLGEIEPLAGAGGCFDDGA